MKSKPHDSGLTQAQQTAFTKTCRVLNIRPSTLPEHAQMADNQEVAYLAADSRYPSLISPQTVSIPDLEALQYLTGRKAGEGSDKFTGYRDVPEPWSASYDIDDLDGHQVENLKRALKLMMIGHEDLVPSYAEAVTNHFFPLTAIAFPAQNITVKSGQKLHVKGDGHNPAVIPAGTLTLEEGGQIICEVDTLLDVQNFIKVPASS